MAQEYGTSEPSQEPPESLRDEDIYRRYAPQIFAYLLRNVPSHQDAEDLLLLSQSFTLPKTGLIPLSAFLPRSGGDSVVGLTWSPDGKYLAYTAPGDLAKGNTATILAASNWHTVYTYQANHNLLNALTWSPDGCYIATGETVLENNSFTSIVKVWVTPDKV
jgi:WD40 repeat protein